LVSPRALAASSAELGYSRLQVYSGALRYLRIDLGYQITEKDADAAYLLFKYQPHDQKETSFGAFEIVEVDGRVRLLVKLPRMPAYHESVLRDGLVRKLREDYGDVDIPRDKPPRKGEPDEKAPQQDDDAGDESAPSEEPSGDPPKEKKGRSRRGRTGSD
jgi:hypothetical protein